MISDETGLPVLYNEAYAQMIKTAFGIEMKPGLQMHKLFPNQKTLARWKGFHQRALSGEQFTELYSHDFGNNITHHFEVSFTPIIEAGIVRGFIEITRDITEQMQFRASFFDTSNEPGGRVERHTAELLAINEQLQEEILERIQVEEALIESEEKFNLLVNNSPDMTMLQNSAGVVTYISPQCQSLLGLRPLELLGKNDISFVHSEDRAKVQQASTAVLAGKKIKEFEYRIIGNDGELRWVSHTAQAIKNNEEIVSIQSNVRNITRQKKAEEALWKNEQKHRLFLEKFDGIAYQITISTFRTVFFLGTVEEITGYTGDDFCAGRVAWNELIHPNDLEKVRKQRDSLCDIPEYVADSEYRIRTRDGQTRWVRDIGHMVLTDNGQKRFVQGTIYDITKRKKAEEIIANQNIQLEQKNIALREFLTQLEKEKENLELKVIANIEKLVKPQLERLKSSDGEAQSYILDLIDHNLTEIISSFGIKMMNQADALSPREIEICNMIKDGLSSKEIAGILNIAETTVIRHRNNIRNKLGIRNTPTNLSVFLNSI